MDAQAFYVRIFLKLILPLVYKQIILPKKKEACVSQSVASEAEVSHMNSVATSDNL